MLTPQGISSTVFTVRLDTTCYNIMFAVIRHNPFPMIPRRLLTEQGHIAGPPPGARFAAAGRRWLTPLGGG